MSTIKINNNYFLSKVGEADVAALVKNLNDLDIYNNTLRVPHPYKEKDAAWFINHVNEKEKEFGRLMEWSLRKETGELIGGIGLQGYYGKNAHKDKIGYWLAKPYWNKGIMTDVLKTFCTTVFEMYNLVRLEAEIYPHNPASMRIVEKCGFKYEGLLRKCIVKDNKYLDVHLYALVK